MYNPIAELYIAYRFIYYLKNSSTDKHKLEKRFNIQSKESIVFDIVEKFINKNIDVDINRSLYDLDYIELRILYVLYKEYDIDLLNLLSTYNECRLRHLLSIS